MVKFTKMHGAGNDYIYINGFIESVPDPEGLAHRISDRHFGVGSDGLVLILPSASCDFRMRMFNGDGSEAEMCGNASRCIGKYVYEKGLTAKNSITLETKAGIKVLRLDIENDFVKRVCVDMGEPELRPSDIPVLSDLDCVVNEPIVADGRELRMTCVSMGNPHAVIFMDSLDDTAALHRIGREIECHRLFPKCTNVEFVRVISPEHLQMRVWERGAGETLACGTGACASLVAAVYNGMSKRKAVLELLGGLLDIEWNEVDNRVYMTGEAVTVFEGEFLS